MRQQKRILVVTPYFYPHYGGTERYTEELYRSLLRTYPEYAVEVIAYDIDKTKRYLENYQGLTIHRIPGMEILPGQFALPNYFALVKLLRRLKKLHKYEILNAQTRFFDTAWWGIPAAKYLGAKAVLTDHCAGSPVHASAWVQAAAEGANWLALQLAKYGYSHVVATSRATARYLQKNGVRVNTIVPGGIEAEQKRTRRGKTVRVLFAGRMIAAKGAELLAAVASKLVKTNRKVSFTFIGDGEQLAFLKKHYEMSRIRFLGPLLHEEVLKEMRRSEIFVLPSTHHEGLPSTILEAAGAGCALVATNKGSIGEIVSSGKTGILVKPTAESLEKALERLLRDKALRVKLGENARAKAEKDYSWREITDKYVKFLHE